MVKDKQTAFARYAAVTVSLAFLLVVLQRLRPELGQTSVALVLVLLVIAAAMWAGRGPALYSAIVAGLGFNFFFIEPLHTFRIGRLQDVIAFFAFVVTAIIVGQLSSRLEKGEIQSEVQKEQLVRVQEDFERASAQAAVADTYRKGEQLKTALLDAVTHDLRTPLTSIKAAISTVRGTGISDEGRGELYEIIEQEADRLNRFIQGMMDLAQLEAGRLTLESRAVSADEVIEDALARAEPLLANHTVEITVDPALPSLKVDPRLISQVLFTLTENAAKYSQPGTRIGIAAHTADGSVCFAVSDEGPGIAPEVRSRLFQKFSRVGTGAGFGLGLAIARGIVQAHSGRIWIEDGANGKGSCFRFQIPIAGRR